MTTVAVWLNKHTVSALNKNNPIHAIWAVSDSRITARTSILLDSSPKLFRLNIKCQTFDGEGFIVYFTHSIGMAYSGNSLVGLNFYVKLNDILGGLLNWNSKIPSIYEVSISGGELLKQLIKEVGLIITNGAYCEVAIFGFCCASQKFKVVYLKPEFTNEIGVSVIEQELNNDENVLLLGDKKQDIRDLISQQRELYNDKNLDWWNTPMNIVKNIVKQEVFKGIGGGVQTGIATQQEFGLLGEVMFVPEGNPGARVLYQNLNISEQIFKVGDCTFFPPGVA